MHYVLTVNAGSSSLKVAVFDASNPLHEIFCSTVENIGQTNSCMRTESSDKNETSLQNLSVPYHAIAISHIEAWLKKVVGVECITCVGHRIVHGGEDFNQPILIDDSVVNQLKTLENLDLDHMPAALACIHELRRVFRDIPHVACFDTAFFREIPRVAQMLPLPRRLEKQGVRRYGFHGISYSYLLSDFATHEGHEAAHGRVIMAHLGSGASLAAIHHAKPVDMTMGFTPASGIPMSTRSGDIDPGVVWYLHRISDQGPQQFNHMVNKESGLLGVSETTGDMHALLQAQSDDPRAAEAVEMFCYHITKTIGGLTAAMGGLDSLIFSGGIGQRSSEIRRRICHNLRYLGVELDSVRNHQGARLISSDGAGVGVHVISTNEEQMIARQTLQIIKES